MALLRILALAGLLTAVTARAENEPPAIKVVGSWLLAASDLPWHGVTPATHGLRLTLIVLRDTAWNPETILAAAKDMVPLLANAAGVSWQPNYGNSLHHAAFGIIRRRFHASWHGRRPCRGRRSILSKTR